MDKTQMINNNTYTIFDGYNTMGEVVAHYQGRDLANDAMMQFEIVRWESREVTAAEYTELFDDQKEKRR